MAGLEPQQRRDAASFSDNESLFTQSQSRNLLSELPGFLSSLFASKTQSQSQTFTASLGLGFPTTKTLGQPGSQSTSSLVSSTSTTTTPTPSTFSTSTVPASSNQITPAPSAPASSLYPQQASAHHHGAGLSSGALAATIVLSLVAGALIGGAVVACIRCRRRRSRSLHSASPSTVASHPSILPTSSKEKSSETGSSGEEEAAAAAAVMAPVVMSSQNQSYFTGLDTASISPSARDEGEDDGDDMRIHPLSNTSNLNHTYSHNNNNNSNYHHHHHHTLATDTDRGFMRRSTGGTTFFDPPPPYMLPASSPAGTAASTDRYSYLPEMQLSAPISLFPPQPPSAAHTRGVNNEKAHDPPRLNFGPDPSLLQASEPTRPGSARSTSARSVASTLYSDSASVHSVHSARAVRVSTGVPLVVTPGSRRGSGEEGEGGAPATASTERRDPFDDPNSSASSLA